MRFNPNFIPARWKKFSNIKKLFSTLVTGLGTCLILHVIYSKKKNLKEKIEQQKKLSSDLLVTQKIHIQCNEPHLSFALNVHKNNKSEQDFFEKFVHRCAFPENEYSEYRISKDEQKEFETIFRDSLNKSDYGRGKDYRFLIYKISVFTNKDTIRLLSFSVSVLEKPEPKNNI